MPSVSGLALLLSNCTIEHIGPHVSKRGVGHGNAVRDYRWPNQTIPYYFDASWDSASLEVAMRNTKIAADEIERMVYTYGGLNLSFVDTTNLTDPKLLGHCRVQSIAALKLYEYWAALVLFVRGHFET